MPMQNLISASLADEVKTDILADLARIRSKLDFLISLDPEQAKSLHEEVSGFTSLLDISYGLAVSHPILVPPKLSMVEYSKDLGLIQSLHPIQYQVNELALGLRDTIVAAHSDALAHSMEIYSSVTRHVDSIPGLAVAEYEMSQIFQRNQRNATRPNLNW